VDLMHLIKPQTYKDENEAVIKYSDIDKDNGLEVDVIAKIPVELISPNPFQPRMNFDPEALDELKKSILANGLIQPITVRRVEG
jgi:ParB family transcriptional regulator, chromosome partitioning protein